MRKLCYKMLIVAIMVSFMFACKTVPTPNVEEPKVEVEKKVDNSQDTQPEEPAKPKKSTEKAKKNIKKDNDTKAKSPSTAEKNAKKTGMPKNTAKSLSIKSVSWMIENLDPSIWNGTLNSKAQMFVSFFVSYSGNFSVKDVKSIVIESPVDVWVLSSAQLQKIMDIDTTKNVAEVRRLQCGQGLGAVALGDWNFELTDSSGKVYKQVLNIKGFAKNKDDKKQEDANKTNTAEKESVAIKKIVPHSPSSKNEIVALSMPIIKSVSRDSNSIEIYFSVNDNRVKNGYFWFDVPGEKYYKDSGSMIDASGKPVNGCRVFSTDGKMCRYILRKDSENSEWFNKITGCFFVASDTNRVSSPWEERIRTVSAFSPVK